jgi:hypothetical protein
LRERKGKQSERKKDRNKEKEIGNKGLKTREEERKGIRMKKVKINVGQKSHNRNL